MASADTVEINPSSSKQILFGSVNPSNNNIHHPQNFQITLSENIGVAENSPQKNDQTPNGHAYEINLSEKIALTENHDTKNVFVIIKQYSDPQAITDRTVTPERIRVNGK